MGASRTVLRTMPETVKIGAKIIDTRVEENLKNKGRPHLGFCSWNEGEIALEKNQSSHEMVNTFIHEVLHLHCRRAGAEHFGDFHKIEEYVVNLMGNVICEIITENPDLVRWMVNTLRKPDEGREKVRSDAADAEQE